MFLASTARLRLIIAVISSGFLITVPAAIGGTDDSSCGLYGETTRLVREATERARQDREDGILQSGAQSILCPVSCGLAWEPLAPVLALSLDLTGSEGAAAGVIGNEIYVAHGYTGTLDVPALRIYDIAADLWSLGTRPPAINARSEGVGAVVAGKFYSIGGRTTQVIEEYDPATTLWLDLAPMPTARKGMAVGVIGGLIHVVGGSDGFGPNTGTPYDVHEVYDPTLNSWSVAAPLPVPLADIYSSTVWNDKLYVFGGFSSGAMVVDSTFIYDAATNMWSTGSPMPTPRSNSAAGVLCDHIFVIGGLDSTGLFALDTVEAYDPVTDSWCTGPPKPTPAAELATGLISTPSAIYAIGSGPGGNPQDTHEALVIQSVGGCATADLSTTQMLLAYRNKIAGDGAGATFEWQPDANAAEYHINSVRDKRLLCHPESKRPSAGAADAQCSSLSPTTTCDDLNAIADGTVLYYQAFSACGPDGLDEGPPLVTDPWCL